MAADVDIEAFGLLDGPEGPGAPRAGRADTWLLDRGFRLDQIRGSVASIWTGFGRAGQHSQKCAGDVGFGGAMLADGAAWCGPQASVKHSGVDPAAVAISLKRFAAWLASVGIWSLPSGQARNTCSIGGDAAGTRQF
jgi:hypothetical protein